MKKSKLIEQAKYATTEACFMCMADNMPGFSRDKEQMYCNKCHVRKLADMIREDADERNTKTD